MKRFVLGLGLVSASFAANADFLGPVANRTADITSHPQLTVEGFANLGNDADVLGAQLGYKIAPNTLLIADIGRLDLDGFGDDIGFGGGVIYQLNESLIPDFNMAIKGTIHLFDAGSGVADVDFTEIGVELVVSPVEQNIIQGADVFGYVGLHNLDVDVEVLGFNSSNSDIELSFGAGALLPVGNGEAYGAIEFIDGLSFGVGYRIALGQ